jgi:predicted nucleic acid-binding protein
MTRAVADTGPLVAYLDRAEQNHAWAVEQVGKLDAPLLVCEPVLAEAMFLLGGLSRAEDALWELLENGALRIALRIEEHV